MPIKFEGQFNYRDESKVNAGPARAIMKSKKCASGADYSPIRGFGLPCGFAK
jgi:hypothetical protein